MRKVLVTIFLAMAAGQASAEWTLFESDESSSSYFDKDRVVRSAETVKMWFLFDSSRSNALDGKDLLRHSSSMSLFEFDCRERRVRTLQGAAYQGRMGTGQVAFKTDQPAEWSYVAPNGYNEGRLKIACAKTRTK